MKKTPTITQDRSLHRALTRKQQAIVDLFYSRRLKQLRREARRKRLRLLWLKIKRLWVKLPWGKQ